MEEQAKKLDLAIGGQALIEGVMIRSPHHVSVAVRAPDGTITSKRDEYISLTKRVKFFGLPIVRGIVNLFEMMIVGMKALDFSARIAYPEEEDEQPTSETKKTLTFILSFIFSLVLAVAIFKFVPLFITEQLRKFVPLIKNSTIAFNLTDGLIRMTIFFSYIGVLSLFPSFRRIFEYHGAEHKAVFVYEKGEELTIANVQKESPRHPRCGTSFIIIVLIASIFILSLVPRNPIFIINLLTRLSVVPFIAGFSYEILKFTAKHQKNIFVRALTYPGILTQYITTKEPDDAQVEVAIESVKIATQ